MCVLTVSTLRCSSSAISSLEAGPSARAHSASSTRRWALVSGGAAAAEAISVNTISRSPGSWKRTCVPPTRITSRWRSVRRPITRSSLMYVPFVERPSSSTVQVPSMHSSDAWVRETWWSHGSGSPLAGARPIVSSVVSSGSRRCSESSSRNSRNGVARRSASSRSCSSAGVLPCGPSQASTSPLYARSLLSVHGRRHTARALARLRRAEARRPPGDVQGQGAGGADASRPGVRRGAVGGGRQLRAAAEARRPRRPRRRRPRRGARPAQRRGLVGAELRLRKVARARRSPQPEDDLDAVAAAAAGHLADAPRPAEVDLRAAWHEIGDQGHTASCVGWTVADSVLRWQLVGAGRLAPAERLSVRQVWMAAKETDQRTDFPSSFLEEDGTSLKFGLDVVRRFGAVLEAELPW